MPTYEMFWDCRLCGTEKLLGKTHRHCPSCGSPQDPDQRYFPSEDEKVAVEDHVFVGADRTCSRCETPQAADAKFCTNCGAGMEEGKEVGRQGEVEAGQQGGSAKPGKPPPEPDAGGAGVAAAGAGFGLGCTALVGLAVLAVGALCVLSIFWTAEAELVVKSHDWERAIVVERLDEVSRGAWCEKLPRDATDVRRKDKERGTKRVLDGRDCKTVNVDQGDGTFKTEERCKDRYVDEPVYDDWCDYRVLDWEKRDTQRTRGGLDDTPTWPVVQTDGCKRRGCTREGKRTERYRVVLNEPDGTPQSCDLPEARWREMPVGSSWKGEVSRITGSVDCDSLAR